MLLPLMQCQGVSAELSARPNFVIIMVDDMGYGDAGCYGGTAFPTPNLDRMAAQGMRFTDFHSSGCVCSPTRAGLLTGRYQQRAGIPGVVYAAFDKNRHHGLQHSELTFAEVLRDAGYATAMFGKWHLGYEEHYNPVHQGFDRYVGYVSGNVDFHSHIDGAGVFDWWHQGMLQPEAGYTTHLITKHSCDFVRAAAKAVDQPFCLYIAHEAPHDPYQGPNDKPVRREGESKPLYNHREPAHAERAYAEMMIEMDKGVGEVLATLKSLGIDEDTFVMFFSDNGATGPGNCGGLYGMKGTLWEGGHRVPGIARWPGRIPAASETDQLACTIDVMPTLLDLAGVTSHSDCPLDGASLRGVLLNDKPMAERQLFWQYADAASMRDGDWKLILNGGNAPKKQSARHPRIDWDRTPDGREEIALFNLSKDIHERTNLAQSEQTRVDQMRAAIAIWQQQVTTGATRQPEQQ